MPKFTVPSMLRVGSTGALAVAGLAITAAITVGSAGTASAAPVAPMPTCAGFFIEAAPGHFALGTSSRICVDAVQEPPRDFHQVNNWGRGDGCHDCGSVDQKPHWWGWNRIAERGRWPGEGEFFRGYSGEWWFVRTPDIPPNATLQEWRGQVFWVCPR